jgi:hypothetical protein
MIVPFADALVAMRGHSRATAIHRSIMMAYPLQMYAHHCQNVSAGDISISHTGSNAIRLLHLKRR